MPLAGRQLGEAGLKEAMDRLQDRVTGEPDNALISLAEALHWLYALHEWHRSTQQNFFSMCGAAPEGETLRGIVYARGLLTHGMTDVTALINVQPVVLSGGSMAHRGSRILYGGPIYDVRWAEFGTVPAPQTTERHGRDQLYVRYVSQRTLMDPLNAAAGWLRVLP